MRLMPRLLISVTLPIVCSMFSPVCAADDGRVEGEVVVYTKSVKHHVRYIVVSAISDNDLQNVGADPKKARAWQNRQTGKDGEFVCSRLPLGVWHFYAFYPGYRGDLATAHVVSAKSERPEPTPIELREDNQNGKTSIRHGLGHVVLVLHEEDNRSPQRKVSSSSLPKGEVRDEFNRPVQGATVLIFAQQNGHVVQVASTETDQKGEYFLTSGGLPKSPEYVFTISKYGYESDVVLIRDLAPRSLNQRFEMHLERDFAEAEEIEPLDVSRQRIITAAAGRTLEAMPLPASRSLDSLALVIPGVLLPPETRDQEGPSFAPGIGTAGTLAINGLRSRNNSFMLDGTDDNDEFVGVRRQGFLFSSGFQPEAVQEFQLTSALPDVRFGRDISGQVNVVSKSSVGVFHGTLYNFYTNSTLKARDFFEASSASLPSRYALLRPSDGTPVFINGQQVFVDNPTAQKPEFERQLPGGILTGQILGIYTSVGADGDILRGKKQLQFAVPTIDQRRLPDSVLNLLPNNSFPVSVPGDAVFSFFPFPNNPAGPFGANTFTTTLPIDGTGIRYFVKLDKNLLRSDYSKFSLGGQFRQELEKALLPAPEGAVSSTLSSRINNYHYSFYIDNFDRTENASYAIDLSISSTSVTLTPQSPASVSPNASLLLDVTPVVGGIRSQPEQYLTGDSLAGNAKLSALGYQGIITAANVLGPFGQLNLAGFSPVGVDPSNFPQKQTNLTAWIRDNISFIRGHEIYLFGVDTRFRFIKADNNRNSVPQLTFSGLTSVFSGGGSISDESSTSLAAAGLPTGVFQTLEDVRSGLCCTGGRFLVTADVGPYFQFERSIGPNIRINVGSRIEIHTVPDNSYLPLPGFRLFNRSQLLQDAAEAEAGCAVSCNGFTNALAQAFQANYAHIAMTNPVTFGPRVGLAWSPLGNQKWLVRAGFGIYQASALGFVGAGDRDGFNRFIPLNLANSPLVTSQGQFLLNVANPLLRQLIPGLNVVPANAVNSAQVSVNPFLLLTSVFTDLAAFGAPQTFSTLTLLKGDQNLANPYSQHYTLTVEREMKSAVVSLAYVGTRGIHLLNQETPEGGILRSAMTLESIAIAGGFPTVRALSLPAQTQLAGGIIAIAPTLYSSAASSTYHSLQGEFRGRIGRGIQWNSSVTYSHAIDDASDIFDLAGAFALPQSSIRPSERASSNFDSRWRFAGTFIWDIAYGRRSRWFGGWQLAGIGGIQSGQPFTVNTTFDVNRDGNLTDRLDITQGLQKGPFSDDPTALLRIAPSVPTQSLLAAEGQEGRIGRNSFRSWASASADVALTKTLDFLGTESKHLMLRMEVFNILNHPDFAIPVRILESPAFGKSTQTTNSARTFQIVAKWSF